MLLYPVLLHGAYDSLCFFSELNEALSLLVTICLIGFCIWLFKFTTDRIKQEAADNEYIGSGKDIRRNGYDIRQDWTDRPDDQ